ncbi:MAG: Ferredoxin-2 [Pelotomaculum sp. PtaU1.Bin035]|nr:MAG: Ferredoxin-2 [Pelotomaculum sp. PtaU1.Bin035]
MKPIIDSETCVACAMCYDVCPADPKVFEISDIAKVVHPEACMGCMTCEENCPTDSITITE